MKIETNGKSIKILFIVLIIMLALPSIIYVVMGNSIVDFYSNYNYIFQININHILDGILFLGIFGLICLLYIIILKNHKKIFKDNKDIFKYIIIISVLFTIILPMTSTDIFYYISTGWSEAKYGVNPYYTAVYELCINEKIYDDEILNKIPPIWKDQKIVYGPVWPLVCRILTTFSFGNLELALFIFKMFNLCLHLLNCKLFHNISKKRILTLLYALNPLILFEGLSNVHNDMLLIFLVLLALYLAIKKKNIVLSVIILSIATAVKYVAILIVPFVVIYYFRKEKVYKRFLNAIWLAIIFLVVLVGIYLLYARDIQIIQGIFAQQGKLAKSFLLIILFIFGFDVTNNLSTAFTILFIIFYLIEMFIFLFKKKITLNKSFGALYTIILIFLLLVITNFQVWYLTWLLPLIIWQKKKVINSTINLTIASELACTVFFIFGESYVYGPYFSFIMIGLWILFKFLKVPKLLEIYITENG